HAAARIDGKAASLPGDPPVERTAPAQHGIDVLRDRGAILGAGEAVAAKIFGNEIVGRRAPFVDALQQADRRLDAGAGGHDEVSAISAQPSALPRARLKGESSRL